MALCASRARGLGIDAAQTAVLTMAVSVLLAMAVSLSALSRSADSCHLQTCRLGTNEPPVKVSAPVACASLMFCTGRPELVAVLALLLQCCVIRDRGRAVLRIRQRRRSRIDLGFAALLGAHLSPYSSSQRAAWLTMVG